MVFVDPYDHPTTFKEVAEDKGFSFYKIGRGYQNLIIIKFIYVV